MGVSVDHIVEALAALGGQAHLDDIVTRVSAIAPPPLPVDVGASVRARIQERCAEAKSFKGGANLFFSVHGVDARRGEWGLRMDTLSASNPDGLLDDAEALIEHPEGKAELRIHLRRERSIALIRSFKATLTDFHCQVCGFDFETAYGAQGHRYIEAHHSIPVSKLRDGATTKLVDLVALCANCHRMVHRNGLMDWRELRGIIEARSQPQERLRDGR